MKVKIEMVVDVRDEKLPKDDARAMAYLKAAITASFESNVTDGLFDLNSYEYQDIQPYIDFPNSKNVKSFHPTEEEEKIIYKLNPGQDIKIVTFSVRGDNRS